MGKLDGRVAFVTGASRGIGKAIAVLFAQEGAQVACVARTLNEGDHAAGLEGSLNSTFEEIQRGGGKGLIVQADISQEEECERAVRETREAFGPIDILVNDAALNYYIPIKDYPTNRWLRAFQVNVHAPFMLSKLVLPDMIAKKSGAIINISSSAAIGPGRAPYQGRGGGGTMYGITKAALERFTQGLAQEVYEDGITVAALSPSQVVPTPGTVYFNMVSSLDDPRGEPPDVMARASLLLASEPLEKVSGRVTYSQAILKEFGWTEGGRGPGIDRPGSGFSQI
jgi:NAD(P)-dependent dehydrogenase (short-subunit alcohol dehydrogenase family)